MVRNSRTPRATDAAENPLIARLRRFMELTPEETDALLGLQQHRVRFPAHAEIVAHGQKCAACYIVQEGWGCRYKLLPNGRRQVLDFVLPGDFIGLHSTLMGGASHAVEAITNVIVGYGIAVVTQLVAFPWFGLPARISDALGIGAIFTIVSIARSFALRRVFEAIRIRRTSNAAER